MTDYTQEMLDRGIEGEMCEDCGELTDFGYGCGLCGEGNDDPLDSDKKGVDMSETEWIGIVEAAEIVGVSDTAMRDMIFYDEHEIVFKKDPLGTKGRFRYLIRKDTLAGVKPRKRGIKPKQP